MKITLFLSSIALAFISIASEDIGLQKNTLQESILRENWASITVNNHELHAKTNYVKDADTAVLIIAGSGATNHNGNNEQAGLINNAYKMLAEALNKANISVLRPDKRGVGRSASQDLDMSETLFPHYVEDVVEWTKYLKKSHKKVYLMGHSLGGLMSIQAAQKIQIDGLITLASVADSGYKTIKRQLSAQPPMVSEAANPLLDKLANDESIKDEEVPVFLNALFHSSLRPYLRSFMLIEPRQELTKINTPTLAIIGDTDIQISVEETKAMTINLPHVQLEIIKGMNHVLKVAPSDRASNMATYAQPELPLHEELMPAILNFIR